MRKKIIPGDKVLRAYDKNVIFGSSEGLSLCEVLAIFMTKAGKRPWQYKMCYVLCDFENNCKCVANAKDCVYLNDTVTKKLMELEANNANDKDKKKKKGGYL